MSTDWANMAQQELCKAKVRKKFSALKKKFNESHDSSNLSMLGHHRSSRRSEFPVSREGGRVRASQTAAPGSNHGIAKAFLITALCVNSN